MARKTGAWTRTVVYTFARGDLRVCFEPLGGSVPGFTHRVLLLRDRTLLAKDWLGRGFRPSVRVAAFYAEKHGCQPSEELP